MPPPFSGPTPLCDGPLFHMQMGTCPTLAFSSGASGSAYPSPYHLLFHPPTEYSFWLDFTALAPLPPPFSSRLAEQCFLKLLAPPPLPTDRLILCQSKHLRPYFSSPRESIFRPVAARFSTRSLFTDKLLGSTFFPKASNSAHSLPVPSLLSFSIKTGLCVSV